MVGVFRKNHGVGFATSSRGNSEKSRYKLIRVLSAILNFSSKVSTENKLNDSFLKNEI